MTNKRDAWVEMPPEEVIRGFMPPNHPYDFGFMPAMSRLIAAHPQITPVFGALFAQIMFAPGALTRTEREMVAAIAAAAQDCHY